jgi:cold shock CspA family protein
MRFTGKLTTWHDDRGFGFITPDGGGQDIFVHISELPRGIRPSVGQTFGFEVALNPQGKKKAVGVFVHRPESVKAHAVQRRGTRVHASSRVGVTVAGIVLLVLCGIGYGTYWYPAQRVNAASQPAEASLFKCDGRTYCSQMTSCKEAKYFLKTCPGVQMDGNRDGIPCEQQWCTGVVDQLFR